MNTVTISQRPSLKAIPLSPIGLGTVKFGRNTGVKYPKSFQLPDDKAIQILLETAQHYGINWLDTAPAYGNSEERLGKIITRQNWFLVSKAGEEFDGQQSQFCFDAAKIMTSVERSLRRLKTDYLDLLLLHSDGNDLDIIYHSDAFSALNRLKEQGKIRHFGMSCKTPLGAEHAITHCDALMLTLNPEHPDDLPIIYQAAQANKLIIIKKGFGSGHLIEKYGISNLCHYLFAAPITAVVLGTLNPEHLRANCQAIYHALNTQNFI